MRQHTKLVLLAVAGCAVIATAACGSPSNSAATPPAAAPSASAGVGAAADEGVGSAATPTASPVQPGKKPSIGQGGQQDQGGKTDQGGQASEVNWKKVAFQTLGCKRQTGLPERAEVKRVDHADLTGDGQRDAIVVASCPTTTSTNAVHVYVFEGNSTGKPLLDAGQGLYLRTADVQTSGRKITVDAEALSDDAPLCCPDLRIQQSWTWSGSGFETKGPKTTKIG